MVTEFGIKGSQSNFEALFDGFDTDGDGSISLKEFVLLLRVMSDDTPEDKVKWAFATYDENKDGLIDTHEMKRYTLLSPLFSLSLFVTVNSTVLWVLCMK